MSNDAGKTEQVVLDKEEARKIINPDQDPHGQVLFQKAQQLGEKLKSEEVTVHQIRKIYTELKRINYDNDGKYKYRLRLVKARIAYTAGRFEKLKFLIDTLNKIIDVTLDGKEEQLKRLKDFFEAVIAYHKSAEGSKRNKNS